MKITVIGGSGFLGSHIADYLSKKKHKVQIFDKKKSKYLRSDQKMVLGDISYTKDLARVIEGSDIIYHFAGVVDIGFSIKNPHETLQTNIIGTNNILSLCNKFRVKKVIIASTIYVQSSQGGFYKISKQASELLAEEYKKRFNLNYTIVRYGSIYGPRSNKKNGLTKIIHNFLKTKQLKYDGTRKAKRKFIHVKDAARASVDLIKSKYNNKKILITGKNIIAIKDVLKMISSLLRTKKKPKYSNVKQLGHYDISPYSYKKTKLENYFHRNVISFKSGIKELISNIKNRK